MRYPHECSTATAAKKRGKQKKGATVFAEYQTESRICFLVRTPAAPLMHTRLEVVVKNREKWRGKSGIPNDLQFIP